MEINREPGEAVLIDKQKPAFVKRCPSVRHAEYWADILKLPDNFIIAGPEKRHYAALDEATLRALFANARGRAAPAAASYSELVQAAALVASELPLDETPIEKLHGKLRREPTAPITVSVSVQPGQVNQFVLTRAAKHASGGAGGISPHGSAAPPWGPPSFDQLLTPAPATVKLQPQYQSNNEGDNMAAKKGKKAAKPKAEKKAKAAKAPKTAKAPKADRVIQNDVMRPKAGGKCAVIWDAADKISAKLKAPAPIADVMAAVDLKQTTEGNVRAEYQRWRKFNGLSGRTPKPPKPKAEKAPKEIKPAAAAA